jgi:hypothetical protein
VPAHRPLRGGGERMHGPLNLVPAHAPLPAPQDTAKALYDVAAGGVLLDLCRAGTPLIEIVTHPDLRTAADAAALVSHVVGVLRAVGASEASMETVRANPTQPSSH